MLGGMRSEGFKNWFGKRGTLEAGVKKQQLVAVAIFGLVVLWLVIPHNAETTIDESSETPKVIVAIPEGEAASENANIITVRAKQIGPQTYIEQIRVRGRTQAYRHVEVRAEQAGRIVNNPVARGARVSEGDILCEIAIDNREADLQEATSRQEQAQFEYAAALDLQERGLQSDVAVSQLKAALESSKAQVTRAELALQKTKIIAPFDGIVETRNVEMGDLLNVGTVCASIIDDSPMLLVGLVPEQDVSALSEDASVSGRLLSGELVSGTVSYIARAADPISRSYRIEIEVDAKHEDLREGITVELMVDANEIAAHLIPSSALTLDDSGSVGVKIIDSSDSVMFQQVEIVGDNTNQLNPGIWVKGLQGSVTLITLGQEIVFPGQTVQANFDWDK
ncbi:MAG TPA: efflux RND transporter periplasmic adaptor subunit [Gammaproteobacteria bacterium]|jgi:multidrug efflux system membrane fusion protein|nr:efflux RND transporter periplasmic adaptor subunit [Gammaproteobacteria bacterium]|tara:strand:+ start:1774 stop:2955 length:1182 start_codon:yes stop_codon:yes gene_type:complete